MERASNSRVRGENKNLQPIDIIILSSTFRCRCHYFHRLVPDGGRRYQYESVSMQQLPKNVIRSMATNQPTKLSDIKRQDHYCCCTVCSTPRGAGKKTKSNNLRSGANLDGGVAAARVSVRTLWLWQHSTTNRNHYWISISLRCGK